MRAMKCARILLKRFHNTAAFPRYSKYQNPLDYAAPYQYDEVTLYKIGNRETVGYGINGEPIYFDEASFPFPSIRFKEPTQEILALREREKGDWKRLSVADKKLLYRSSFCQTFAEFQTPRPAGFCEIVGWGLIWVSVALFAWTLVQIYVNPELPDSFSASSKRAQMRRQINLQVNPIRGLSSNWDYEKMDWKKKGWFTPQNPFVICSDDDHAEGHEAE